MKIKPHYIFKTILVLIALAFIGILFTKHEKVDDPKTRGISLDIESRLGFDVTMRPLTTTDLCATQSWRPWEMGIVLCYMIC